VLVQREIPLLFVKKWLMGRTYWICFVNLHFCKRQRVNHLREWELTIKS